VLALALVVVVVSLLLPTPLLPCLPLSLLLSLRKKSPQSKLCLLLTEGALYSARWVSGNKQINIRSGGSGSDGHYLTAPCHNQWLRMLKMMGPVVVTWQWGADVVTQCHRR
jgi:hypothetical protein